MVHEAVRITKAMEDTVNSVAYDTCLDPRNNTYMREWVIPTVSNLTMGNEYNVTEIDARDFNALKTEDRIEMAALEAFINSATGQLEIK